MNAFYLKEKAMQAGKSLLLAVAVSVLTAVTQWWSTHQWMLDETKAYAKKQTTTLQKKLETELGDTEKALKGQIETETTAIENKVNLVEVKVDNAAEKVEAAAQEVANAPITPTPAIPDPAPQPETDPAIERFLKTQLSINGQLMQRLTNLETKKPESPADWKAMKGLLVSILDELHAMRPRSIPRPPIEDDPKAALPEPTGQGRNPPPPARPPAGP